MTEIKAKHIHSIKELNNLKPGEVVILSKGDGGIFCMDHEIYFGVNEKGYYEFLQTAGLDNGIYVDTIHGKNIRFNDGMILTKESERYQLFDGEKSRYNVARNILMKKGFLQKDFLEGEELREHLREMDEIGGFSYFSTKMEKGQLVIIPDQKEPASLRERIKQRNLEELLKYDSK